MVMRQVKVHEFPVTKVALGSSPTLINTFLTLLFGEV